MKRPYNLDFSIESDVERMEAVRTILDNMEKRPTPNELEQLASYVLYGKDESGKNSVQRGETDDRDTRRYNTFKRADEKVESLDALLESPLTDEQMFKPLESRRLYVKKRIPVRRPVYNKDGTLKDIGDADIPGMVELWAAIDHVEHTYAANQGQLEFNEDDTVIDSGYRLWQLHHQIVDMRRHQYYLRDYYKPTIPSFNVIPTGVRTYNWDQDTCYWVSMEDWKYKVEHAYTHTISTDINDYETRINPETNEQEVKWVVKKHTFDWENPWHIKCLMRNYSKLYTQLWDNPDSWGRTLLYDFDRYFDMAGFTPAREYMVLRFIDGATLDVIAADLEANYNVSYQPATIGTILNNEIPNTMAKAAAKHRLLLETPRENCRKCTKCKKVLPLHPLFFIRNSQKKYGFEASCKECQRKSRVRRGVQNDVDVRYKDQKIMLEMQTGKTDT